MDSTPSFFLASSEGYSMNEPRRCTPLRRLKSDSRDDLLLVRLEPPLNGQRYGMGGQDLDEVVLATRHETDSLFSIREFPVFVHVARLTRPLDEQSTEVRDQDLESIAWAEVYETESDARQKKL